MSILDCNIGQHRYLKDMLDYITDPNKNCEYSVQTYGLSENPYRDFMATKYLFGKYDPEKREYYQFIICMSKDDIAPEASKRFFFAVSIIATLLSRWRSHGNPLDYPPQFHVIFAVHIDKEPIYHAHIIVNNVSYVDGHDFPWNKRLFWLFRNLVNQTLIYYGFSPINDKRLNELSTLLP